MRNEKLKDILDDAVSGIGEDPRLLGKVLSRAENGEDVQMTKKVSTGTLLIAAVIILLMSAGIAAVSGWGVLDFLKNEEKNKAACWPLTGRLRTRTRRCPCGAGWRNSPSTAGHTSRIS